MLTQHLINYSYYYKKNWLWYYSSKIEFCNKKEDLGDKMSRLNSGNFQYFIRKKRQGQPTHFHRHFKARLLYYSISNFKSAKWFKNKKNDLIFYVGVCEGWDSSFRVLFYEWFASYIMSYNLLLINYSCSRRTCLFLSNLWFCWKSWKSWKSWMFQVQMFQNVKLLKTPNSFRTSFEIN